MYTFKKFTGMVKGWWLIVEKGPQAEHQLKNFPDWGLSIKLTALNKGGTICVNRAGGYHYLTNEHECVETMTTRHFEWPI